MSGMASYSPSDSEVVNATFDISAIVFATLQAGSQLAPLPFLQQASCLALEILNTVRGARDNKEAFKSLARDACELVSAIVCVYQDMEKDGLQPSLGLKKRVNELISLLQRIKLFCDKHISKGALQRMVRLQSENGKIQQYRAQLRQALDVFGLQSSISIHENVVQLLKELRDRDSRKKDGDSESSSPPPAHPFGNLFQGTIHGSDIRINTINGNQEFHTTNHHTTVVDSYNGMTYSSSRSS
ncbi:hypothetical protein B0H11DRAFT_2188145 [Mycena galericulata]|nr:hypothetical protein B0H11DRAFT_2188145 [Mycena galericulata]